MKNKANQRKNMAKPVEKKKINKKRRKLNRSGVYALSMIIVIIFSVGGIYLTNYFFNVIKRTPIRDITDEPAGIFAFEVPLTDAPNVYPISDYSLLKILPNEIQILNLKGEVEKNYDIKLENPIVRCVNGRVFIAEQNGYHYVVLNNNQVVYDNTTEDSIVNFDFSSSGKVALVLNTSGEKNTVRVLDEEGELIFNRIIHQTYIISVAFSSDNMTLFVSSINTDDSVLYPIIDKLDVATGYLHMDEQDNNTPSYTAQYRPNERFPFPLVFGNSSEKAAFVGAKAIYRVSDVNEGAFIQAAQIISAGQVGEKAYYIASDQEGGLPYINFFDFNLPYGVDLSQTKIELPEVPREMMSQGDYLIFIVKGDLYRFDINNPSKYKIFDMKGNAIRGLTSNKGNIVVVSNDGVRKIVG